MKVMLLKDYSDFKAGVIYEAKKLAYPGLYEIDHVRIDYSILVSVDCETCRSNSCMDCSTKNYSKWSWGISEKVFKEKK